MATLIPAISACISRMTSGERRVAERLEQKLDDDYLLCSTKPTENSISVIAPSEPYAVPTNKSL